MYNFSELPVGTTRWILLEELCQMSGHCTCALVLCGHLASTHYKKSAWGVLTRWPFLRACIDEHTERSGKEAVTKKRYGDTAQPILAWQNWMLCPILQKRATLGDCCQTLFPTRASAVSLQGPGEDFSLVTHCLAAVNTIFVFLWDTRDLLTALDGMSHTSSSSLE